MDMHINRDGVAYMSVDCGKPKMKSNGQQEKKQMTLIICVKEGV